MYRPNGMDGKCSKCSLSTGRTIHGQSSVPLDKVLLILISAYPSTEEVKQGMTLAPSQKFMNAGKYCRSAINLVFAEDEFFKDFYPFSDYTFFTNAIRCSPLLKREKKDITKEHIKKCSGWFDLELKHLPKVPILLAGSEPVKSLIGFDESMYGNRRTVHRIKGRDAVVTMNPIEPARYHPYEVQSSISKRGKISITKRSMMKPVFGSPPYLFKQDLILVKELVKAYMINNGLTI